MNYRGAITQKVFQAFQDNPDLTAGEIFMSALHKSRLGGKHFWYCSDEEIFMAWENFLKVPEEDDEPLSKNEFEFWIAKKEIIK